jgi:poly-gamma-glutamate synthesis protein (capsule biosynthesis protein)
MLGAILLLAAAAGCAPKSGAETLPSPSAGAQSPTETPYAAPTMDTDALPAYAPASPEPTPIPTPVPTPTPTPTPTPARAVTIAVGGDVLPAGNIGARIEAGDYGSVLDPELAARMRAADVTMVNLETAVSERGAPIPEKTYTFRTPPQNLAFLREWLGTDVVSLANNHTFDYGRDAFLDTLVIPGEYGLAVIGAGEDYDAACRPFIAEAGGVRIAFFAVNQILSYTDWPATATRAGHLIARTTEEVAALGRAVAKARETCDYVIVYLHWGVELDRTPSERQVSTARALIDAGADVILGAHPHVVQSFEYYKGKPIAYSVGNFLFNSRNPELAVVFLHIENGAVTLEAVPCLVSGTLTSPAGSERAQSMLTAWSALSRNAHFDANGRLVEE